MKNSKVISFLSPFKVGQAGNLWTLPRMRHLCLFLTVTEVIKHFHCDSAVLNFAKSVRRFSNCCVWSDSQGLSVAVRTHLGTLLRYGDSVLLGHGAAPVGNEILRFLGNAVSLPATFETKRIFFF